MLCMSISSDVTEIIEREGEPKSSHTPGAHARVDWAPLVESPPRAAHALCWASRTVTPQSPLAQSSWWSPRLSRKPNPRPKPSADLWPTVHGLSDSLTSPNKKVENQACKLLFVRADQAITLARRELLASSQACERRAAWWPSPVELAKVQRSSSHQAPLLPPPAKETLKSSKSYTKLRNYTHAKSFH